jgi:hypothetical protein
VGGASFPEVLEQFGESVGGRFRAAAVDGHPELAGVELDGRALDRRDVDAVVVTVLVVGGAFREQVACGFFFPEPVTINPRLEVVMDLWSVTVSPVIELTTWQVTTMGEALVFSAMGVVALVVGLHLLNAFAWLLGYVTMRTFEYARVLVL